MGAHPRGLLGTPSATHAAPRGPLRLFSSRHHCLCHGTKNTWARGFGSVGQVAARARPPHADHWGRTRSSEGAASFERRRVNLELGYRRHLGMATHTNLLGSSPTTRRRFPLQRTRTPMGHHARLHPLFSPTALN